MQLRFMWAKSPWQIAFIFLFLRRQCRNPTELRRSCEIGGDGVLRLWGWIVLAFGRAKGTKVVARK
jgi:hypothetical protein